MDHGSVVTRLRRPCAAHACAAMGVAALALLGLGAGTSAGQLSGSPPAKTAPSAAASIPESAPFEAPLARSPLTPPLSVTGGFGEYRVGHFHAGLDFGTGGVVGKSVFAPLDGHIERLRASGVGYGRSIYLRARDGRLVQFGHLDAFAEPMAAWVASKQDSSGQYEQDLWPEPSRFPVRAGERIAWTGQSGAGGPHMHFEIRRGDMAYHPMRAGLVTPDKRAPTLVSVTLEPLDDTSYVEGSAAPVTRRFRAGAETLSVIGRVRAVVGARDGVWRGVDRMVPWLTRMEWGANWIECRMDSISWATDMNEGDYVFDAGRVVGDKGIVLWASRGFRPRFIGTNVPRDEDAGTIRLRPGDPPLSLRLEARDVAGHVTRRTVLLRAASRGPDTSRTLVLKNPRQGDDRFEFAALPRGFMRVTYKGGGAGTGDVWIGFDTILAARPATPRPAGWTAVVRSGAGRITAWGRTGDGSAKRDVGAEVWAMQSEGHDHARSLPVDWEVPQAARFDSSAYLLIGVPGLPDSARTKSTAGPLPSGGAELANGRPLVRFGPGSEPLRKPMTLLAPASPGPHTAVYRHDDDGWTWVGDERGGAENRYQVESRRLGWFAEFEDTLGPRISLRRPLRKPTAGPYSRWALEAAIVERGSGVDARACYMVVDGKRVPAEWDPEADVLRWRPLARPKAGTHRYDVVVADRAGNLSVRSGTFVLD